MVNIQSIFLLLMVVSPGVGMHHHKDIEMGHISHAHEHQRARTELAATTDSNTSESTVTLSEHKKKILTTSSITAVGTALLTSGVWLAIQFTSCKGGK